MAIFAFYIIDFPSGGTGTAVQHTANELARRGHKVIIFAGRHMPENYALNIERSFEVVQVPDMNPNTGENIEFLANQLNENMVSAFVVVAMHFLRINELRKKTRCKVVYALHGVPFYEGRMNAGMKHRGGILRRIKYWLKYDWQYRYFQRGLRECRHIYDNTISSVDRYVVLHKEYKRLLEETLELSAKDREKICVIPNGIEQNLEEIDEKEKIIIFVGRLTYADKRPMRLVNIWEQAYKELTDWRFVVVGDGEEKDRMQKAVHCRGIERMEFVGYSNDVNSYYRKSSIICLTSEYEGWGLCLAEGQAYGVVPMAFNCSAGVDDIISPNGQNGLLVTPYNCEEYAHQLVAIAKNPERLHTLSQNCIEKAKTYTMERNSKGYCELLEGLAK